MDFESEFKYLTDFKPLKWQTRLFTEHFASGTIPPAVDIPTGLGKTSVMAIWFLARKVCAKLPRRLIYVVDRRAVVDQATTIANRLKERSGDADLRISTLRGQYVDNREWLEDPGKPAIIVGTVNMIGSRLLFSGYGVSRKTRSYHAGLLGADSLIVLDESHLVPPLERLLEAIETDHSLASVGEARRNIVPCFRLLSLSATGQEREGKVFRLDERKGDLDEETLKRLDAAKRLTIEAAGDRKLEEVLAQHAWRISGDGCDPARILVYCDKREVAENAKAELEKTAKKEGVHVETELFVGARRVRERMNAADLLRKLGFLSGSEVKLNKPAFVFATSAGEVGVDMDADRMVCDLVAWERMVQRLGRVNRVGGEGRQAEVTVITEEPDKPNTEKPEPPPSNPPEEQEKPGRLPKSATEEERVRHAARKARYEEYAEEKKKFEKHFKEYPEKLKKYQAAWKDYWIYEATLALLTELHADASPRALLALKRRAQSDSILAEQLENASTPPPLYPALTRALVDAWSMTSLDKHTGRPEVGPWLRGWVDDAPQTALVWRKYLPLRTKGKNASKTEIEGFFDAALPHTSEKLETDSWRVKNWLEKRAQALAKGGIFAESDTIAYALDADNSLHGTIGLRDLQKRDDKKQENGRKKKLDELLPGATLVLDERFGGLSENGLLSDKANEAPAAADADDSVGWPVDMGFCIRATVEGSSNEAPVIFRFAIERSEEGEDLRCLYVMASQDQQARTSEDSRAAAIYPQLLEEHESWAEDLARSIASTVGLSGEHADALALAARLHDEGKKAKRWQLAFNAPKDGVYAKTKGPLILSRLGGYRHEFGSLPYAEQSDKLKVLPEELQDLVLHLIASHHGQARPVIGVEGCDEAPPSLLKARARDVSLRFARLQRQWGPWGLAWWEALLRAADQQASRDNDQRGQRHG